MNTAASVRARLLNLSKQTGEDFQAILNRYAIERFLYRLGASDQVDKFILKGAMLFVAWQGNLHRPTKDLDLLGFGNATPDAVGERIGSIAASPPTMASCLTARALRPTLSGRTPSTKGFA